MVFDWAASFMSFSLQHVCHSFLTWLLYDIASILELIVRLIIFDWLGILVTRLYEFWIKSLTLICWLSLCLPCFSELSNGCILFSSCGLSNLSERRWATFHWRQSSSRSLFRLFQLFLARLQSGYLGWRRFKLNQLVIALVQYPTSLWVLW